MFQPWRTLTERVQHSPSDPMITWYGPAGERVEMSVATFANAVAKTVGFINDELMLAPGDRIAVALGLHWQTCVWLHASAVCGLNVTIVNELTDLENRPEMQAAVDFDSDALLASSTADKVLASGHPLGLPGSPPPGGLIDAARETLGQPDVLPHDADAEAHRFELTDESRNWQPDEIQAEISDAAHRLLIDETSGAVTGLVTNTSPTVPQGWQLAWGIPSLTQTRAILVAANRDIQQIAATERALIVE